MNNYVFIWVAFGILSFLAIIDDIVKGYLIVEKEHRRKGIAWKDINDFWKDSIPNDNIFRLRWVYVLVFVLGMPLTAAISVYFQSWYVLLYTIILLGGTWEHLL